MIKDSIHNVSVPVGYYLSSDPKLKKIYRKPFPSDILKLRLFR